MSRGMETCIPRLRRREANCGHFSLVLAPNDINHHIREWLNEEVLDEVASK